MEYRFSMRPAGSQLISNYCRPLCAKEIIFFSVNRPIDIELMNEILGMSHEHYRFSSQALSAGLKDVMVRANFSQQLALLGSMNF